MSQAMPEKDDDRSTLANDIAQRNGVSINIVDDWVGRRWHSGRHREKLVDKPYTRGKYMYLY